MSTRPAHPHGTVVACDVPGCDEQLIMSFLGGRGDVDAKAVEQGWDYDLNTGRHRCPPCRKKRRRKW